MNQPDPLPRLRQRVAVYGICVDESERVLLVRAAAYLTVAGRWFLPGGGIDHGESPPAALGRELIEETGLTVEVGQLLDVLSDTVVLPDGTDLHTVRLLYRIDSWDGLLHDETGGSSDQAAWVPLAEATALPLMPYVVQALALIA